MGAKAGGGLAAVALLMAAAETLAGGLPPTKFFEDVRRLVPGQLQGAESFAVAPPKAPGGLQRIFTGLADGRIVEILSATSYRNVTRTGPAADIAKRLPFPLASLLFDSAQEFPRFRFGTVAKCLTPRSNAAGRWAWPGTRSVRCWWSATRTAASWPWTPTPEPRGSWPTEIVGGTPSSSAIAY
eukprot:GHVT01062537.1.p1 GENE.GHVT01062537.1~~GHVT01062537.1.p1  ORF type:complete len:184 (-),score=37.08 GHVT01062537.1:107-658(-)